MISFPKRLEEEEKILFQEGAWELVESGWWDLPIALRHWCDIKNERMLHPWAYYLTTMEQVNRVCPKCKHSPPSSVVTLYLLVRDSYIDERPWLRDKY